MRRCCCRACAGACSAHLCVRHNAAQSRRLARPSQRRPVAQQLPVKVCCCDVLRSRLVATGPTPPGDSTVRSLRNATYCSRRKRSTDAFSALPSVPGVSCAGCVSEPSRHSVSTAPFSCSVAAGTRRTFGAASTTARTCRDHAGQQQHVHVFGTATHAGRHCAERAQRV